MILEPPQPTRKGSYRAQWAIPYLYPEQVIPIMEGLDYRMKSSADLARQPQNTFQQLCMQIIYSMAIDRNFKEKISRKESFDIDDVKIKNETMNAEPHHQHQALGYGAFIETARKLIHNEAGLVYIEKSYKPTMSKIPEFAGNDQSIVMYLDGPRFLDGLPVCAVHIRWVKQNEELALQISFTTKPGRWVSPMDCATLIATPRQLIENPQKAIDQYYSFLLNQNNIQASDSIDQSRANIHALAMHLPTYLGAFTEIENHEKLGLDVTIPEPFNGPSLAEITGKDIMSEREFINKMEDRNFVKKYNLSERTQPVWIVA